MKTILLPVAAVLLTVSSPAWADDSAPKGDLGQLQGEWEGKAGQKQDTPIRVTFEGNKATLEYTDGNGKKHELKGEIQLDENAKPHKAIDWSNFSGGDEQSANASRGIYELDGDTFKICTAGPDNKRPTDFKAGGEAQQQVVVLKRVKK